MISIAKAEKMIDNTKSLGISGNLMCLYDDDYNLTMNIQDNISSFRNFPINWTKEIIARGNVKDFTNVEYSIVEALNNLGIQPDMFEDLTRLSTLITAMRNASKKNIIRTLKEEENPKEIFNRLYTRNLDYNLLLDNVSIALDKYKQELNILIPDNDKFLEVFQNDFCKSIIEQCDTWDEVYNLLKSVTKKKIKLLNDFNEYSSVKGVPKHFLNLKDNSVNWIVEHVKQGDMLKNHVMSLTDVDILNLIENYDAASSELKELCKKDKLALFSIINNYKKESLVLDCYMKDMGAMRNGVMSYAIKYDKDIFLQNVSNNLNIVYMYLTASSIILDEHIYSCALDIDTVPHEDFSKLLSVTIDNNQPLLKLESTFTWDEFLQLLGKEEPYVLFADLLKKEGIFSTEIFNLFYDKQLLGGLDIQKLIDILKEGDIIIRYSQAIPSRVIGLRTFLKLLQYFPDTEISKIEYPYEARIMSDYCDQFSTKEECINAKYNEICEKWSNLQDEYLIRSGIADVFAYLYESKEVKEDILAYVNKILEGLRTGDFYDHYLSKERMEMELDYKLETVSSTWLNTLEVSNEFLVAREIDTPSDILHYTTYPVTCKYSYKQLDKGLSILDTTKRLICVFKDNDCIATAVMRYSSAVEHKDDKPFPVIVLSDPAFSSNINARDRRLSTNLLIKLATVKANEVGALLCVESGYRNETLEAHLNRFKVFIYNNWSESPLQLVQGTYSNEDWHAVKRYVKMSVYVI